MGKKEWWVKYRRQQFEKRHGGENTELPEQLSKLDLQDKDPETPEKGRIQKDFEVPHAKTGKFGLVFSFLLNTTIGIEKCSFLQPDDLPKESEQVPVKKHNPAFKKPGWSSQRF